MEPAADKRIEKLVKKVRPFVDDKQKIKTRLQWLYAFLETASAPDQAWFFRNFHSHVFQALREGFQRVLSRVRERDSGGGARRATLASKEITEALHLSALYRRVFAQIPQLVHTPEYYAELEVFLRSMLQHGNHPLLRLDGLRTFLCFLTTLGHSAEGLAGTNRVRTALHTELVPYLLGNAILLDMFEPFALPPRAAEWAPEIASSDPPPRIVHAKQRPIEALDCQILLPHSSVPTAADMAALFGEYLGFIEMCAEAAAADTSPISLLNQQYYSGAAPGPSGTSSSTNSSSSSIPHIDTLPGLAPPSPVGPPSPAFRRGPSFRRGKSHDDVSVRGSSSISLHSTERAGEPQLPVDATVASLSRPVRPLGDSHGSDASLATLSATVAFLWQLLCDQYLVHLLPRAFLGLGPGISSDCTPFPTCPLLLLSRLVDFFVNASATRPAGRRLLQRFLAQSPSARAVAQHVVCQGLFAPLGGPSLGADVAAGALHLVSLWTSRVLNCGVEGLSGDGGAVHLLLRRQADESTEDWLRHHLGLVRLLFLARAPVDGSMTASHWQEVLIAAIHHFRFVLVFHEERLGLLRQWSALVETLLLCHGEARRPQFAPGEVLAGVFAPLLDTVLVALARCPLVDADGRALGYLWEQLNAQLLLPRGTNPSPVDEFCLAAEQQQWRAMLQVTTWVYCKAAFGVSLEPLAAAPGPAGPAGAEAGRRGKTVSAAPPAAAGVGPKDVPHGLTGAPLPGGPAPAAAPAPPLGDSTGHGSRRSSALGTLTAATVKAVKAGLGAGDGLAPAGAAAARWAGSVHDGPGAAEVWGDLAALPWTPETAGTAWKNTLLVAGDPAAVAANARLHVLVVTALAETLEELVRAIELMPPSPPRVPDLFTFAVWLFEAAEADDASLRPGALIALGSVCRLICQRHDVEPPSWVLPRFYRMIARRCAEAPREPAWLVQIALNSVPLAGLGLSGCETILDPFLSAAQAVLAGSVSGSPDAAVHVRGRLHLVLMVNSLVTAPCAVATRRQIVDLIVLMATVESAAGGTAGVSALPQLSVLATALQACSAALVEELLGCRDAGIVQACVGCLLDHLRHPHVAVVSAAAEGLAVAVQCVNAQQQHGVEARRDAQRIMEALGDILAALGRAWKAESTPDGRGCCAAAVLRCLQDWVLGVPSEWLLDDPALLANVLRGPETLLQAVNAREGTESIPAQSAPGSGATLKVASLAPGGLPPSETQLVVHACEAFFQHVARFAGLFPNMPGPTGRHGATTWSAISELDDLDEGRHCEGAAPILLVAAYGRAIASLIELQRAPDALPFVRAIVRDATGRWVLDLSEVVSDSIPCDAPLPISGNDGQSTRKVEVRQEVEPVEPISDKTADPLLDLLDHIGRSHPDCLPPGCPSLTAPAPLSADAEAAVAAVSVQEAAQTAFERRLADHPAADLTDESRESLENRALPPEPTSTETKCPEISGVHRKHHILEPPLRETTLLPAGAFSRARRLLSALGWLGSGTEIVRAGVAGPDGSTPGPVLQILRPSASLVRDLRGLDKRGARETIKTAVLYVARGQETEAALVHNAGGSGAFAAFVRALGWPVDVQTHPGYLGGLEKDRSNGATAVYYCDSQLEMVFHDVTRMPNNPDDPKQVRKKRHIGNDHVHIVWTEHVRAYRRELIRGDFGNVALVVRPLADGRYAVRVLANPAVVTFPIGPLVHGAVVSARALGPLVRATAVHAHRTCLAASALSAVVGPSARPDRPGSLTIAMPAGDPDNPGTLFARHHVAGHGTLGAIAGAFVPSASFSPQSVAALFAQRVPPLYLQRECDIDTVVARHALPLAECPPEVRLCEAFLARRRPGGASSDGHVFSGMVRS